MFRSRHSSFRILAISAAVAAVSASGNAVFAQNPLPANTAAGVAVPIVPTGTPPYSGALIFELSSPITAFNQVTSRRIDGSVISSVFRNSSNTLDFLYQFRFSELTNTTIANVSIASFQNVSNVFIAQTGEDIDGPNGLPSERENGAIQNFFEEATDPLTPKASFNFATRPGEIGDGINAGLTTGVTGGQKTFTLIVRTSATEYSISGSSSVQGSGISAFTTTAGAIAPFSTTEAPEPGSIALLAAGLLPIAGGLALRRRRVSAKRSA